MPEISCDWRLVTADRTISRKAAEAQRKTNSAFLCDFAPLREIRLPLDRVAQRQPDDDSLVKAVIRSMRYVNARDFLRLAVGYRRPNNFSQSRRGAKKNQSAFFGCREPARSSL